MLIIGAHTWRTVRTLAASVVLGVAVGAGGSVAVAAADTATSSASGTTASASGSSYATYGWTTSPKLTCYSYGGAGMDPIRSIGVSGIRLRGADRRAGVIDTQTARVRVYMVVDGKLVHGPIRSVTLRDDRVISVPGASYEVTTPTVAEAGWYIEVDQNPTGTTKKYHSGGQFFTRHFINGYGWLDNGSYRSRC